LLKQQGIDYISRIMSEPIHTHKDIFSADRPLLDAFRKGDQATLEKIYRYYAPVIARFLRCGFTLKNQEKSVRFDGYHTDYEFENALQEVFTRAFSETARLSFDGLHPYFSYLCGIARNYVIDEYRKQSCSFTQLFDFTSEDGNSASGEALFEKTDNPEILYEENEVRQLLNRFKLFLTDKQQTLYKWRFEESYTQDQIAQKMGLTRVQIRRLEAKLKKDLLFFLKKQGYLTNYSVKPNHILTTPKTDPKSSLLT
jgi:RNA polymerase sigma-70 factor, ECF subfamily